MHPRRRLLKRIGAGLGLVGSSVLLSKITPPIYAQTTPIEIEPGSFVETADYIVFEKDGEYYAKNGRTGEVEFGPSDDASQVIQNALNTLIDVGGKVFIKKAEYPLSNAIDISGISNLELAFERGCLLYPSDDAPSDTTLIESADSDQENVKIHGATIDMRRDAGFTKIPLHFGGAGIKEFIEVYDMIFKNLSLIHI